MPNDEKTRTNKTLSIISIILLGAISAGLWEILLKDFVFFLGNIFVSIASSVYYGYTDTLYKNVGKRFEGLLYFPGYFLIISIIVLLILGGELQYKIVKNFKYIGTTNRPELSPLKKRLAYLMLKKPKRLIIGTWVLMLFAIIIYTNILISEISNVATINYIERVIEIVRPVITDKQYFEYRSEFRQINSKDKVIKLITKLADVAEKNNMSIPTPKLFGIEIHNKAFNKEI